MKKVNPLAQISNNIKSNMFDDVYNAMKEAGKRNLNGEPSGIKKIMFMDKKCYIVAPREKPRWW